MRKVILWVSSIALVWSVVGFFIVPLIIKHVAIPQINKRLNGQILLERAACNPYALGLILEHLKVVDESGGTLAGFDRFDGRFEFFESLFRGGWRFRRVVLSQPQAHAELFKDGQLNFITFIKPRAVDPKARPREPLKQIPRVVVDDLRLLGADASFKDHTPPEVFEVAFTDTTFRIDNLDTRPERNNPHTLTATTASGERISWEGDFHVDPLSSKGRVTIQKLGIARFMPYAMVYTDGRIVGGALTTTARYAFAPARAPREARLTIEDTRIDGLAIKQPDGPLLEVPSITLSKAVVDADARSVEVDSILIDKAVAHVRRDEKGVLNLERLLNQSVIHAAASRASVAAPQDVQAIPYPIEKLMAAISHLFEDLGQSWSLGVQHVQLVDAAADYGDRGERAPVDLRVSAVNVTAGPIKSAERYRIPVQVAARINEGAAATFGGILGPIDRTADGTVKVTDLNVAPFAPYLPEHLGDKLPPIRLGGAMLFMEGKTALVAPESGASSGSWSGEIRLSAVRVDNAQGGAALASIDQVAIKGDARAEGEGQTFRKASWKGEVDAQKVTAEGPFAGPVKLTLDSLKLASADAGAELTGSDEVSFSWKGTSQIASLSCVSGGEVPASAAFATLNIEGAAAASAGKSGLSNAMWSGTTAFSQLAAETKGPSPLTARAQDLTISGDARAVGSVANDLSWKGKIQGGQISAKVGGATEAEVSMGAVSLDGDAGARLAARAGAGSITWNGSTTLGTVGFKVGGPVPGSGTVESVANTGDTRAELGESGPTALSWKGETRVTNLSLDAMPENPVQVKLASAQVRGDATASNLVAATPDLLFTGEVNTGHIDLDSPQRMALKAAITSVVVKAIDLNSAEKKLSIADLLVESPAISAATALLPPPTDPKNPRPPLKLTMIGAKLREAMPLQLRLAHAKVSKASYDIKDDQSQPPSELRGEDADIELTNLASDGQTIADLAVNMRVQQTGQLRLGGKLDLFRDRPYADLKVEIASLPIKPYEAFTGRFLGYLVEQGRVAATVPLKVEENKVSASLDFNLDKFYVGQAVRSPDAPDVPIELGLALLRDSNEQIKGNIPISGNLDDPNFSLVGVVWQAVLNLVVKAATSPFQLLGAVLGAAEGEDLSFIAFDPGLATMPPESIAKLDKLGKGLLNRPGLKLQVIGRASQSADVAALQRVALRQQLGEAGGDKPDDARFAKAVEQAYYQRLGQPVPTRRRGEPAPVALADMEKALLEGVPVAPDALATLAQARAEAVVSALVHDSSVPPDRVTVVQDKDGNVDAENARADLVLH